MKRGSSRPVLSLLLALLAGCEAAPVPPAPALSPEPAVAPPPAGRHFGAASKLPGEAVPVERLLSAPEPYLGQAVKCAGRVERVCRSAGCWLELQAESGGASLRVPMAGHAFFIPQDAVGQLAEVEGELSRRPLPDSMRDHYAGEGMKAVGPLALEATSVTLR